MIFRALGKHHNRAGFDCGNERINAYLRQTARQQQEKDLARTVVMIESEESTEIVGFFTLLMSTISCDLLPVPNLPRGRLAPIILLAQFGIDRRFQGRGHGKRLLFRALFHSMQAAEYAGCKAVVLDPIDEKARQFYSDRGFEALNDEELWMPISRIREAFQAEETASSREPES